MKTLRTVFAIGIASWAMLVVPASSVEAASAATSCTGYARAVADHLRPGAAKGSPEYRAVYFPTFDECLRRGGATAMPGGLAAAPWYLPKPPAPAANPYNPTPPAAPSSSGGAPSAPVATPKPPVAPAAPVGPTPAQVIATAAQKIAQGLPGGMNYPLAVKAGLEGCGKFAIFQANAAGPNGSAKWQETASGAVNWCVQKGGVINGDFTSSPHVSLALRMIKYKTAPASAFPRHAGVPGTHACAAVAGAPDYMSCVTDQGQWFVCYKAGCHLAEPALVLPGGGGAEAIAVFHNCPGAQCRVPAAKPLASGQSLDAAARGRIAQCNAAANAAAAGAGAPGSPAWNQAGQASAAQCLAASQPRIVAVAGNKALGTNKGRECGVGEDGQTYCIDDDGVVCVVQSDGSCGRIEESITVTTPPAQITQGTTNFFNCPGGNCMVPGTDGPRKTPGPGHYGSPPSDPSEPEYKKCVEENRGRDESAIKACFIERCIAALWSHSLMAGATEAQRVAVCELAYKRHKQTQGEREWQQEMRQLERQPERPRSFWDSPAGEFLIGVGVAALIATGVTAAVVFAPGVVVMGAAAAGVAVLVGVGAGSSGGAITGKSYGSIGDQACRPHMQKLINRVAALNDLDGSSRQAVEDFVVELCALNLPDIEKIRVAQRGTYQGCETQARNAQPVNGAPPIVAITRALNQCLRQNALAAGEKATLARSEGLRFADQWSALLRDCAGSWGLQWRGTLEEGAAWPVAGTPTGDLLPAVSGCVLGGIR